MEPKALHSINACVTTLSCILIIVALAGNSAMWSSEGSIQVGGQQLPVGGCGLFNCDGAVVCGCKETGCQEGCPRGDNWGQYSCPTVAADAYCNDLAGHMAAAQGFAVVALLGVILAMIVSIIKITSYAEKIPYMCLMSLQCVHIVNCIMCLVAFALVAASYDQEFCGCTVKDQFESGLSYGFVFLILGFILQAISALLVGFAQANEAPPDPLLL